MGTIGRWPIRGRARKSSPECDMQCTLSQWLKNHTGRYTSQVPILGIFWDMQPGTVVCMLLCTKCRLFAHPPPVLFRPRVFPHALGCGARRGPACTLGANFGPRPGSVARALGVQSRDFWQLVAGLLSDQRELTTRPLKTPKISSFFPFFFSPLLPAAFLGTTAAVKG